MADVEVLVVAGGGGAAAGGGGGGGVVYDAAFAVAVDTYAVVVGDGGTAGAGYPGTPSPGKGEGSSFDGTLVAEGGGKGGVRGSGGNVDAGEGGCGGGGYYVNTIQTYGGNGTQGYDGGGNANHLGSPYPSGGGGGMSGLGGDATSNSVAGVGGIGVAYWGTTYAAGGAGRTYGAVGAGASGGTNTGNGGQGAGGNYAAGAGGPGVVIVRYPDDSIEATGGDVTSTGGYTYHTFTTDGTFEVTAEGGAEPSDNSLWVIRLFEQNTLLRR